MHDVASVIGVSDALADASDPRPRADAKLMQVAVHGSWLPARDDFPARLVIWAEVAVDHRLPLRRGRKPTISLSRPRPHPFAAPLDQLREVLSTAHLKADYPSLEAATLVARLPSVGGAPSPSPDLAVDPDSTRTGQPELAAWELEGLALPVEHGIELLLSLAEELLGEDADPRSRPTEGALRRSNVDVAIGEDLRFWIFAARISLELLYRQRLVPTLQRQGNRYLARWRPLLDDEGDRRRVRDLARALPPIARSLAWTADAPEPAPRVSPGQLPRERDRRPRSGIGTERDVVADPKLASTPGPGKEGRHEVGGSPLARRGLARRALRRPRPPGERGRARRLLPRVPGLDGRKRDTFGHVPSLLPPRPAGGRRRRRSGRANRRLEAQLPPPGDRRPKPPRPGVGSLAGGGHLRPLPQPQVRQPAGGASRGPRPGFAALPADRDEPSGRSAGRRRARHPGGLRLRPREGAPPPGGRLRSARPRPPGEAGPPDSPRPLVRGQVRRGRQVVDHLGQPRRLRLAARARRPDAHSRGVRGARQAEAAARLRSGAVGRAPARADRPGTRLLAATRSERGGERRAGAGGGPPPRPRARPGRRPPDRGRQRRRRLRGPPPPDRAPVRSTTGWRRRWRWTRGGRRAARLRRHAPALPAGWGLVARDAPPERARRLPGRRHGTGKDGRADRPPAPPEGPGGSARRRLWSSARPRWSATGGASSSGSPLRCGCSSTTARAGRRAAPRSSPRSPASTT